MGDFEKHLGIAKEKIKSVNEAYSQKRHSVVGDLATKVVEQLIEADAAKANKHFGTHKERHEYSNASFPKQINKAMQRLWFAYGDLGYDGTNGKRTKEVMEDLRKLLDFFKERFDEEIA